MENSIQAKKAGTGRDTQTYQYKQTCLNVGIETGPPITTWHVRDGEMLQWYSVRLAFTIHTLPACYKLA